MSSQIKKTAHGGCPHDCPDTCSMVYEIENNKLVGVKGNPAHPMTRGGLCVKLKDYLIRKDLPPHTETPLKIKPQRHNYEVS